MTEEILQAAILRLKASATERFAIIKDLYHRPATSETVDQIISNSLSLAQLEGAMVTLQQYSATLAKQTENEAISNTPAEPMTEVQVEEESEQSSGIRHDQLMERSKLYRKTGGKKNEKDES